MFKEMEQAGSKIPSMVEELKAKGWTTYQHHDNWVKLDLTEQYDTHTAYMIATNRVLPNPSTKEELQNAVQVLVDALKTDEEYRVGWISNLAMAFKDEYSNYTLGFHERDIEVTSDDIHEISNLASENFINLLLLDK